MKITNDLGRDKVPTLVLKLAVPSMLAQLVNVLYSIIDRMFIGHIPKIGDMALAGVGICGPIVTFLTSFGTLIGLGGSILMAMRMGENNKKQAEKLLSNSFLMLVIFSATLTAGFLILKDKLILWFGASDTTFVYANTYLTIYTLGSFFALMAIGLNYFITCQGFAMVGMCTVLVGAVTNIILDALFIMVFNFGVAGAAWATVIAQLFSCIFAFSFLMGKRIPIGITFRNYSMKIWWQIIKIGFSPFFILAMDSFVIIIMNTALQHYGGPAEGDLLISAATIMQSYLLLITGPLIGLTGGTQAIISFNYGAKNIQRIKATEKCIVLYATILTVSMFLITQVAAPYFVACFTSSEELSKLAVWGIRVFVLAIITLSVEYPFVDGLTALGRVSNALFISLFRKAVYIGTALIFPLFLPAKYAFFAQPVADIMGTIAAVIIFTAVFNRHLERRALE